MIGAILGATMGVAVVPVVLLLARRHSRSATPTRRALMPVCVVLTCIGAGAGCSEGSPLALTLLAVLATLGGAALVVDVVEQRLPNRLVLAQSVAVALVVCTQADLSGAVRAGAAALVVGALAVGFALVAPAAFGWGDVKILPGLAAASAAVGWNGFVLAVGLSGVLLFASAVAAGLDKRGDVPFGPALVFGASAGIVLAL